MFPLLFVSGDAQLPTDLDFAALQTDAPKLSHMCKDRPRVRKSRGVQKPILGDSPLIENVHSKIGLDSFFDVCSSSSANHEAALNVPERSVRTSHVNKSTALGFDFRFVIR